MSLPVLYVFSHLRWGFVYQRPQHLLSRLAGRWRIVFVEEPMHREGPAGIQQHHPLPNLTVLVPHTPVPAPGFHDEQIAHLEPLLAEHVRRDGGECAVAWLYTPMALPLIKAVRPQTVVYDCMDELSAFKDAPRQMRQRESALMRRASVVLTGGPSLYMSRRDQHPSVHCLPSSVDSAHFAPENLQPGSEPHRAVQALQGALPGPRVGYYGVIDERLNPALVGAVAEAHPDWQVVMVGPVVKIDPASLPKRPNIHWFGMQAYERLPYFLAGWDVAMMPFALNDSTRFISPTKTLEYMAGGKPVVSTPVRDVISLYGHAVEIAGTPDEFVAAAEMLLNEGPTARGQRAMDMLATVSVNSWDRCADTVHALLTAALRDVRAAARATPAGTTAATAVGSTVADAAPRVAAAGARSV